MWSARAQNWSLGAKLPHFDEKFISVSKKKWPSEFALSPRIYVMGFCKASILRDVHSHERHWMFPFLVFRLRLVRLALVADIHSCSRSTSFWWYTCPAKDVILVHIFVPIVHWLSTQYVYFLINMHLESIDVLNGDQAGLQLRPRFTESKTEQNQHRAQVWLICKLKLTGHWFDYKVSTGAECQSQCSCRGLLWFEVQNRKNSWKLQGFSSESLTSWVPLSPFYKRWCVYSRGNAEARGCHLRSAGVHQRGAKLCTFWIWDIFWIWENATHDFDIFWYFVRSSARCLTLIFHHIHDWFLISEEFPVKIGRSLWLHPFTVTSWSPFRRNNWRPSSPLPVMSWMTWLSARLLEKMGRWEDGWNGCSVVSRCSLRGGHADSCARVFSPQTGRCESKGTMLTFFKMV